MRYELDSEGYILSVFFGCSSGNCTEYTGTVPEGYSTLGEWAENANIRAYKIVEGNLAFDATKNALLQAEYEKEAEDNRTVVYKEIKNITNIVHEDLAEMYKESTSDLAKVSSANDSNKFTSRAIYLKANEDITGSLEIKFNNSNFLTNDATSKNESGISFAVNEDKSIKVNGTATNNIEFNIAGTSTNTKSLLTLKKDTNYYLSCNGYTLKMYSYDGTNRIEVYAGSGGVIKFTDSDKQITQIVLLIPNGKVINNVTIYPMLNLGTSSEPYVMHESNAVTLDLGDHTFNAGDNICIEDGTPTLQNEIYISDNLYIGDDFVIGGSFYNLSSIEMPKTYVDTTYFYTDKDTEIYVTYPNLTRDLEYENTSSKNGGFSVDEEGNVTLKDALLNGGIIKIFDEQGQLLLRLDTTGQHFYDDTGSKIGDIGVINYKDTPMIAFNLNVSQGDDKGMAWGIEKDGIFHPIFYTVGTYFEETSEYGGTFAVEGNLIASAVEILQKIEMTAFTSISCNGEDNIFFDGNKILMQKEVSLKDAFINSSSTEDAIPVGMREGNNISFDTDGTYVWIYVNGSLRETLGIDVDTSDKKLKKNIKDTTHKGLDSIMKINHKEFDWKENGKHQNIGFIAQELEQIDDTYVSHATSPTGEETWHVNTMNILASATKAIQEQQKQIEDLKKQINELKGESK